MGDLAHQFHDTALVLLSPGDVLRDADDVLDAVESNRAAVFQPYDAAIGTHDPVFVLLGGVADDILPGSPKLLPIVGMNERHEQFYRGFLGCWIDTNNFGKRPVPNEPIGRRPFPCTGISGAQRELEALTLILQA